MAMYLKLLEKYVNYLSERGQANSFKETTFKKIFTDFKNDDESLPEIDLGNKIHNKWYFRLYNKIIEEYTNSDEDCLSMNDNYSDIKFYTDWISKLEYSVTGLYLRVNLAELTGFIRDKKISKLLE